MAAGVTDRLWELDDIVRIVNDWEATQKAGDHSEATSL
jgi:hypothetical protein